MLIFVDLRRMSQLACSFLLPMQIPSNVSARVLISDADANSFECLSSRAPFCRFVSNVSARVLISAADVFPRLQLTKKHVGNPFYWFLIWFGAALPLPVFLPPSPADVDSFECLSSRAHFC